MRWLILVALLTLASPALASNRGGIGAPMSDGPRIVYEDGGTRHARGRVPRSELAFHVPHFERDAPVIAVRAAWGTGVKAYTWGANALALAARYSGGGNPTGFYGPWCKAFTNMILRQAGYHPGPSLRAIDGLADGQRVASPAPGDLAVMGGHITFFASWDGPNAFIGLGGNQHRMVRASRFWRGAVVAWIRPT